MRKFAVIVVILVAIPAAFCQWNFPTASYRYRLTVAVEIDGQVHTGSSVIEVWYRFNPEAPGATLPMYDSSLEGQAVLIDLGAHGVLVAALGNNSDPNVVSAQFLAGRAFQPSARQTAGWYGATLDRVRELARMKGKVDLTPDNMPPFIWISNKADPATAHFVKPQDFASVIGDSTRLLSAQVEITRDPVVIDINRKLPLYNSLPPPAKGSASFHLPNGQVLNWGMFIAPGSV